MSFDERTRLIVQSIVGFVGVALSFLYWWMVTQRWHEAYRQRCERRYGVTITTAGRGMWQVSGDKPWTKRVAIELLQLAFFMGTMVVWSIGILLVLLLQSRIHP